MGNIKFFRGISGVSNSLIKRKKEYPIIDKIVLFYVAFVLFFQIYLQITPLVTFLTKTPFYSMQTYLGILGGALIVVDLFTTKRLWQGPNSLLLYGICAMAALASVRMISYGVKENIFKLCWCAIQFTLFYSCAYRLDSIKSKRFINIVYTVILVMWVTACLVSFLQYAYQVSYAYVVNPLSADSSANRQGFFDSRLFGIFYTLNHSALVSTILFEINIFYMIKKKKAWLIVLLCLANLLLLSHIILSGSRNAILALFLSVFLSGIFMVRNKISGEGIKRFAIPVISAILITTVSFLAVTGAKNGLKFVPSAASKIYNISKNSLTFDNRDNYYDNLHRPQDDENSDIEYDEQILDRDYLEADQSNGRFGIWKDYVMLYKEIGPIGLSPGNYMKYVSENHPELFIVSDIKENYPAKYESGIIYHTHNGYLLVLVGAGWIGFALFLAFLVLSLVRVLRKFITEHNIPFEFILMCSVVVIVGVTTVFDEGIFFQNNPQTTAFWLSLGFVAKECSKIKKESIFQ